MTTKAFANRQDAARQVAEALKAFELHDPVVLGIPRGGVVTAAAIARQLGAEADVVLARKLRHPEQPEFAIGSISEEGEVHVNEAAQAAGGLEDAYLEAERQDRFEELKRRREKFRRVRPAAPIRDRSVIITDDGIATGSTMLAALDSVKAKRPREVIVAVPVAPPDRFEHIRQQCDRTVCVMTPSDFMAIGQFYDEFEQVGDEQVCEELRQFAPAA